jgi:hypothetical protein
VYVADWSNDRIVVFDAAGRVREFGGGELTHQTDVAVDGAGMSRSQTASLSSRGRETL